MILKKEQIDFIDAKIGQNIHLDGFIIRSPDQDLMSIIIFNPLVDLALNLKCPTHDSEELMFFNKWTHNSKKKGVSPRLLYGVEANTILVSALYSCSKCDNPYRAHDPSILGQKNVSSKFHLFTRSGLTEEAYNLIINLVYSGMTFKGISTTFKTAKGLKLGCQGIIQTPHADSKKFTSPSYHLCEDIFVQDFYKKLPFYEAELKNIKATHLSIDHTFKVAALLKMRDGIRSKSKKFRQPFAALFLALDEGGRVASFTLTQSKSLTEIHGNLTELARRTKELKMTYSDNCCQDDKDIKFIFGPHIPVKLDIFHALARVTAEIKKKTLSPKHRRLFNEQLKMSVRKDGDGGDKRAQSTASARKITESLETLKQQWQDIIPERAVKAIKNLLVHSKGGCLSNIPCGGGTGRNECFHRHLRKFMGGRPSLGAETLLALLHTFIYSWNARLSGETHISMAAKAASYKPADKESGQWAFGLPFRGAPKPEDSSCDPDYDPQDILEIVDTTESLAAMSKHVLCGSLPLTAEDIILRSNYEALPLQPSTSNDHEEYFKIDKILEGMKLKRMSTEEGGHNLFKAIATQLSILESSDQYGVFLKQTGLASKENPLMVAKCLKEFIKKELMSNNKEYKPQGTNIRSYRAMVSELVEEEEYSAERADMLFRALANVLRTYAVLITSSPTCPIMFVRPTKSALSMCPINLVYLSHARQFAGVVPGVEQPDNMPKTKLKQKRCNCGRKNTTGCISHSCSCYAKGISCDIAPQCWCKNCANKHGQRGASVGLNTECNCGKNLKSRPTEVQICSTTRCCCFLANKPCSTCKCKFCGNKHGQSTSSSASGLRTPTKRAYTSKHSGKIPRTPTRQFMEQHCANKLVGRWSLTESILLNEVMNYKVREGKITVKSATKLFNYIVNLKPHLGQKKNASQIAQKWKNISNNKTY